MKKGLHCKAKAAILFKFDTMEERGEDEHSEVHKLKASKWNPKKQHTAGCWRMDVSKKRKQKVVKTTTVHAFMIKK